MKKLLAYHGDKAIKRKYLARVRAHRKANRLIRGTYWDGTGRGCAVGCCVETSDSPHARYPIELGIPEEIAYLEDTIFERLPKAAALEWPENFLTAIPVGADLSLIWPRFAVWLLSDPKHGVARLVGGREDVRKAIKGVSALYSRWLETGKRPGADEFGAAEAAAARAAAAAEEVAAEAAAEAAASAASAASAARTAAVSARAAGAAVAAVAAWAAGVAGVAMAAWAAGAAGADEGAKARAWKRMAAKLLELLRGTGEAKP